MPEYLAPGVFVEEIDSGSKPIEGVGINTAAFVGYCKSGEFNKPIFISSWSDFCRIFGEEDEKILKPLSDEVGHSVTELLTAKRESRKSLLDFAQTTLNQAIKHRQREGVKDDGKAKSWSEFVQKNDIPMSMSPFIDGTYMAYAIRGYYDNGGGRAYIVRVARESDLTTYKYEPSKKALPSAKSAVLEIGGYAFKALKAGSAGNDIEVEVSHEGDEGFVVKISGDGKPETIGTKDAPLTPKNFKDAFKSAAVEGTATKVATRPQAGTFSLSGGEDAAEGVNLLALPISKELARVEADEFIGDTANRTGFSGLSAIEDVNMICVPDLMAGVWKRSSLNGSGLGPEVLNCDDKRKQAILDAQSILISFCERMGDRMCILDPIPGLSPQEMRDTTLNAPFSSDHGQGTIYYPWIKVPDVFHKGQQVFVPPCGHVAGVWARVGTERGVHKAPANEALMGAVALEYNVSKGDQEILNPEGINAIRSFPGTGIRIWGARTLATVGNPSWKYVNVRRLFNYLEKSIERGMQWAVFEPNDQDLWARVRRNISAFLFVEWREGKLFGATPDQAYYVKCDRETNPQETIDLGRLYVEVGVNPVKPAEFVIIRMGQWAGGADKEES